jgi:acyl carrier protein
MDDEVTSWIKSYLARITGQDVDSIDADLPFERFGLDSTAAVGLSGDLGALFHVELSADAVFEHPTIRALAAHVRSHARYVST